MQFEQPFTRRQKEFLKDVLLQPVGPSGLDSALQTWRSL
jgi:hypothetical protein